MSLYMLRGLAILGTILAAVLALSAQAAVDGPVGQACGIVDQTTAVQDESCECDTCSGTSCPDWCFVCPEGQHWDNNGGRCGCMEDCTADEHYSQLPGEMTSCQPNESCADGLEYCYIGAGECLPGCMAGEDWDVESCECSPEDTPEPTPYPEEDTPEPTPDLRPWHGAGDMGKYCYYPLCFESCSEECVAEGFDVGLVLWSEGHVCIIPSVACGTAAERPACLCAMHEYPVATQVNPDPLPISERIWIITRDSTPGMIQMHMARGSAPSRLTNRP